MAIFSTLSFAGPLLPSAQIMRVELFEHAGPGVGENVRNLAKLPAILLPAHVHAAANQAVITPPQLQVLDATVRWLSSMIVASDAGRFARSRRRL